MFPIKDTIRSRSFPIVNWLIILANALVFLYELSLSPARLERFVSVFGLAPVNFHLNNPLTWAPLFTTNPAALPFKFTDFDVRLAAHPQKFYRARQP